MGPPATTEQVLAVHDRLARYVHGHFRRKLSVEDAHDIAAEALAEADRAVHDGQQIADLERWLRRAAWHNALDAVRRIEGEGKQPRERPVDLADHVERLADHDAGHHDLLNHSARTTDARALRRAWAALKPDEQRALHLRYFDELDVGDVISVLGCSRHHYDNLIKRALAKLRKALVADTGSHACRQARSLVLQTDGGLLEPAAAAERDAHLDSCLPCRAFARRSHGLLAALPVPATGLIDRLAARLHSHTGNAADLPHTSDTIAGSIALASAAGATATGGTAAASGLIGGGAAKALAIICTAGAVTASVCTTAAERAGPAVPEPSARAAARSTNAEPPRRPGAQRNPTRAQPAQSLPPAAAAPNRRPSTTTPSPIKSRAAATTPVPRTATRSSEQEFAASTKPSSTLAEFDAHPATTPTAERATAEAPTFSATDSAGRPASAESAPAPTGSAAPSSAVGEEFSP